MVEKKMVQEQQITPAQLRKMQLLQLDILKAVDHVCRKNGLKYTLCGGSLLGAVRHQGFIPWDDDIDITLLRKDYDRLISLCRSGELDSDKYFVQTIDTDPGYRMTYAHIILNGTRFIRAGQEHLKVRNGIFIDVIPRDDISDNPRIAKLQNALSYVMRKSIHAPVGFKNSRTIGQFIGYGLLVLGGSKWKTKLLEKMIIGLNFGKETSRAVCWGLMDAKEKAPKELGKKEGQQHLDDIQAIIQEGLKTGRFSNSIGRNIFYEVHDAPFEDMQAMVMNAYDQWLAFSYGDYMKLPPEEKRVIHQTFSTLDFGVYE